FGSQPFATARMVMSRSVKAPTNRSFSQIGRIPTSRDFIFCAASRKEASGPIHSGLGVMISLTFIIFLWLNGPRWRFSFLRRRVSLVRCQCAVIRPFIFSGCYANGPVGTAGRSLPRTFSHFLSRRFFYRRLIRGKLHGAQAA